MTAWGAADILNPVMAGCFNAAGDRAAFGWPNDPEIEALRARFARAGSEAEQKQIAETSKTAFQPKFKDPIATDIVPLVKFYPAEEYHQNYMARNPNQGYVRGVVTPKAEKFKHKLEEKGKLKEEK